MTNSAHNPAATSSTTIPVPSGSRSSCRTGGGFTMSKPLKSINAASRVFHVTGTNNKVIHWPATSSITTNPGSFFTDARATRVAAGMPIAIAIAAMAASTKGCSARDRAEAVAAQIKRAAADPHVPGPGPSVPMPKNVAVRNAHNGARPGSVLAISVLMRFSVFIVRMPIGVCLDFV
jgi:hypothetical protein